MKFRKVLLISGFASLMLTGCNFNVKFLIPQFPGNISSERGYEDTDVNDDGFSGDLIIWCDEKVAPTVSMQLTTFISDNKDEHNYNINFRINPTGEDSAATTMITNVRSGADIYVFPEDQLNRLKMAGALSEITGNMKYAVTQESTPESIKAATLNNALLAFPYTSDNGYFMYYDKRAFNENEIKSIDVMLEKCKTNGWAIAYDVFGTGWYTASYFNATGCVSDWTIDKNNTFIDVDDTINSDAGIISLKGLKNLRKYDDQFSTYDVNDMKNGKTKAVISGVWDYKAAYEGTNGLFDDLGCAPMPSFEVDGQSYQISPFKGHKLVGVKPSSDEKRNSVCLKIARYLSNENSQYQKFLAVNWGPTNKNVKQLDVVKAHQGLQALEAEEGFAKSQTPVPEGYFDNLAALAQSITENMSEEEMRSKLATYDAGLEKLKGKS